MKKFFILLCAVIAFFPKFSIAAIVLNTNDCAVQITLQKHDSKFQALHNELKSEQKSERKLRSASRILKFLGIEKLEERFLHKSQAGSDGDKLIGLLLGFFLGLIGVLIAYIIGNRTMIKYSWYGVLVIVLIVLLALALRK